MLRSSRIRFTRFGLAGVSFDLLVLYSPEKISGHGFLEERWLFLLKEFTKIEILVWFFQVLMLKIIRNLQLLSLLGSENVWNESRASI